MMLRGIRLAFIKRSRRPTVGALVVLAIMAFSHEAAAQVQLQVTTPPEDMLIGQPIQVQIAAQYSKDFPQPTFPDIPGCEVAAQGPAGTAGRFHIDMNGQVSDYYQQAYVYSLTPKRIGQFEIPQFNLAVDGRMYRTQKTTFIVRRDDSASFLYAHLSAPQKRLFVGQQVNLTLEIWVRPPDLSLRGSGGAGGLRPDATSTWRFIMPDSLAPFDTRPTIRIRPRNLPDGSNLGFFVYTLTDDIVLSQPGPLQLPNMRVRMRYPTEYTTDLFGDNMVTRSRSLSVEPEVDPVEVLPLPTEGRPADFTGAVGVFSIAVGVNPSVARVGDPMELTIELRGEGPLDTLPPPPLLKNAKLLESFRVPDDTLAGENVDGRRRYRVTIRPTRVIGELPPITYSYFDPIREEYATTLSPALPLHITAGDKVESMDVVGLPTAAGETPTAQSVAPPDGLRPNRTNETALLTNSRDIGLPETLAVTITPPALFVMGVFASAIARARRDGPASRRRNALANAMSRICAARDKSPLELAAEIHVALGTYLSDRLNEPIGRYVGRAGVEFLVQRGVAPALAQRWEALVESSEAATFGGMVGPDAARTADEACDLLATLERERL